MYGFILQGLARTAGFARLAHFTRQNIVGFPHLRRSVVVFAAFQECVRYEEMVMAASGLQGDAQHMTLIAHATSFPGALTKSPLLTEPLVDAGARRWMLDLSSGVEQGESVKLVD